MTNKPISNNECHSPKQCAEGEFWSSRENRILWKTVEQNAVNGRQGVCYVFPNPFLIDLSRSPSFEINRNYLAFGNIENSKDGNRNKVLNNKPGRWWEFWK